MGGLANADQDLTLRITHSFHGGPDNHALQIVIFELSCFDPDPNELPGVSVGRTGLLASENHPFHASAQIFGSAHELGPFGAGGVEPGSQVPAGFDYVFDFIVPGIVGIREAGEYNVLVTVLLADGPGHDRFAVVGQGVSPKALSMRLLMPSPSES